ncbi:hypothetical protein [Wolbachia endosymbiont of Laodelphax striatellus]|nr:hypothetical protein [Wolbachia endosymbiont of Laodelphax striatellus]
MEDSVNYFLGGVIVTHCLNAYKIKAGVSIDVITEITGLSVDEIKKLI